MKALEAAAWPVCRRPTQALLWTDLLPLSFLSFQPFNLSTILSTALNPEVAFFLGAPDASFADALSNSEWGGW